MQSSDSTSDGVAGDDERTNRCGRRALLAATAGTAAAALAGCLSGGGGDGGDGELDDWLGDLDEYDGPVDRTGESEVAVAVGAGSDGLAFDPLAVEVDVGTTVVWEWTGRGGRHNVVDRDGAFASEYHDDEGATFSHTFEETGTYAYYCEPHQALGMKGGVRVR
ncbi:halocyanin domain-containing protein [Halorubellus litoreus]|uniref:Halocyanin domain-containing protein n=1 Tax=Halorubellus litoreus TaxID=755308 RepID=A0ABD5VG66_9EURY